MASKWGITQPGTKVISLTAGTRKNKGKIVIKRARAKIPRGLKAIVSKIIDAKAEHKSQIYTNTQAFGGYGSSSVTNQIVPLTPYTSYTQITQGTGQGDRIADKINIMKCEVTGVMFSQPYDVTANPFPQPCEFRVWFFQLRNSNTKPTTLPNFFQNGSNSLAPDGSLLDLCKKVNTDLYILKGYRTLKLGYASYASTGAGLAVQTLANNDFKMNNRFTWDITKMMPKKCLFDDSTVSATSKALFMFFEVIPSIGGSYGSLHLPASIYYQVSTTFTDE